MSSKKMKNNAKVTSTIEDYLERIYILCTEKGGAKVTDIANALEISKPSVTEMVSKMEKYGYVNYVKYGEITLTPEGEKIAKRIKKRHDIIKSFLMLIGVQEENAEKDCCLMEHDLTADTVDKLQKFLLFLKQDNQQDVIERFEKFLEKEE